MNRELRNLVEISQHFGKNPDFVIAGGGNTSFKNNDFLWIKASGTSLATINEDGFAKMDRNCLGKIAEREYSENPLKREAEIISGLFNCVADKSGLRPSVETSLHNLLSFSYVVHTHPTLVNGLMCSVNSTAETQKIFGDDALLVKYTDPGFVLFKHVEKRIGEFVKQFGKEPQIIFLENHGVFVSANNTSEIMEIYESIMNRIGEKITAKMPSSEILRSEHTALKVVKTLDKNLHALYAESPLILEFTRDKNAFSQVSTAFSPDNIVYCKANYLFTKPDPRILMNEYLDFKKSMGYAPKVIGLENCGIICIEENEKSLNTVYDVFLDLMKISFYTRSFGGPRFLTAEQIQFIDSWEVENYRRKVSGNT